MKVLYYILVALSAETRRKKKDLPPKKPPKKHTKLGAAMDCGRGVPSVYRVYSAQNVLAPKFSSFPHPIVVAVGARSGTGRG